MVVHDGYCYVAGFLGSAIGDKSRTTGDAVAARFLAIRQVRRLWFARVLVSDIYVDGND